jgi:hypothetical protein
MHVEKFYSKLPPTTEDASQVANLAVPPESIIEALCELICNKAAIKSIICQHNTLAGGQHYPIHLVFYNVTNPNSGRKGVLVCNIILTCSAMLTFY